MRDIQKEIHDNLRTIEEKYDVRILFAAESGSRAWGFASPDSDYDVRFVYIQKAEKYLKLIPETDVIEWVLDDVLDINGWDLRKFLSQAVRGNPVILEWLHSPVIYEKAEDFLPVQELAESYFHEKTAMYHYYGLASKTRKLHLMNDMVSYKKYLYALRPLLCAGWIEAYRTAPPVEFARLLPLLEGRTDLMAAVEFLLEEKAVTKEKELKPVIPQISEFIETECEARKAYIDSLPAEAHKDSDEADRLFAAMVLEEYGKKQEGEA